MRKLKASNPFCEVGNMRNPPHTAAATVDLDEQVSREQFEGDALTGTYGPGCNSFPDGST